MINMVNDFALWFFSLPRNERISYFIIATFVFAIVGIAVNLIIDTIKNKLKINSQLQPKVK